LYEGDIRHATFPGESGNFSVYPLHAPIISSLKKGVITYYQTETDKQSVEIQSGFVEVKDNQVTACVEE
jgi:F-type H+-transporting ATPase subunit epsilon